MVLAISRAAKRRPYEKNINFRGGSIDKRQEGLSEIMKKRIVFALIALLFVVTITMTACQNGAEIEAEEPTANQAELGINETDEANGQQESGNGQPAPPPIPVTPARNYVDNFIAGNMAVVHQMGSEALRAATSEQTFADLRRDIFESAGEFIEYLKTVPERIDEGGFAGNRYRITVQHTLAQVVYSMFIESATPEEVSGFAILDVDFTESTIDFPYIVETITIGAGTPWELDGRLTLPLEASADNPVPAVVIVQGSGPSDMNGTHLGERIYFDVADYLSANGIAVIRYDKRTLTHGAQFTGSDTVRWESIEDAILAANLLRADPRIGSIFILGHSMGGTLAPRIHATGGNFDGLIIAAGTPRTIQDLIVEQFTAQIELEGHIPEVAALQEILAEFIALVNAIPDMTVEEARRTQVHPLFGGGASAYYFKDFLTHPFENYIEDIAVPILVIQGRNDFQVLADVDFSLLQELFEGRDNVTFQLYDGLDHRFMASNATNLVEHRNQIFARAGARVDRQVLADIAAWIKAN